MGEGLLIEVIQQALLTAVLLIAVPVGAAACVGTIVSILQAATQIQEQSIAFIAKVGTIIATGIFLGPFLLEQLRRLTEGIYLEAILF